MKISYKLVINRDGAITEESFENNELMVERAKALDLEAQAPVAPVEPTPAPAATDQPAEAQPEPEKKISPVVEEPVAPII